MSQASNMHIPLDNEVVLTNMLKFLKSADKSNLKLVSKSVRRAVLTAPHAKLLLDPKYAWNSRFRNEVDSLNRTLEVRLTCRPFKEPSIADPQRMLMLTHLLESMPAIQYSLTELSMSDCGHFLALNKFELSTLLRLPFMNRLEKLQITISHPSSISLFSGTMFPYIKYMSISAASQRHDGSHHVNKLIPKLSPTDFKGLVEADMPCLEELILHRFLDEHITEDAYKNLIKASWPLKSLKLLCMGIKRDIFADISGAPLGARLQSLTFGISYQDYFTSYPLSYEEYLNEEWPKLKLPSLIECELVNIWPITCFHQAELPHLKSLKLDDYSAHPELFKNLNSIYPELEDMTLVQSSAVDEEEDFASLLRIDPPKKLKYLSLVGYGYIEGSINLFLENQKLREQLEVLQLQVASVGIWVNPDLSIDYSLIESFIVIEWPKLKHLRIYSETLEGVEEERKEADQRMRAIFDRVYFPVLEEVSFALYSDNNLEEIAVVTYVF